VYLHSRVIKSCLIWTSLCMLFKEDLITLHWQTRMVWPKNVKIENTVETRHLHLGCPGGKLIYQKLISKWTIPLNCFNSVKPTVSFALQISMPLYYMITYANFCLKGSINNSIFHTLHKSNKFYILTSQIGNTFNVST